MEGKVWFYVRVQLVVSKQPADDLFPLSTKERSLLYSWPIMDATHFCPRRSLSNQVLHWVPPCIALTDRGLIHGGEPKQDPQLLVLNHQWQLPSECTLQR